MTALALTFKMELQKRMPLGSEPGNLAAEWLNWHLAIIGTQQEEPALCEISGLVVA